MYKITVDSAKSFVQEIADAGAGSVRLGVVYAKECPQEINIARTAIGMVYTAILKQGTEQALLEYSVIYGFDDSGRQEGSEAAKAELGWICDALMDLEIKVREGKLEFL